MGNGDFRPQAHPDKQNLLPAPVGEEALPDDTSVGADTPEDIKIIGDATADLDGGPISQAADYIRAVRPGEAPADAADRMAGEADLADLIENNDDTIPVDIKVRRDI